jgi:hypothetical protein
MGKNYDDLLFCFHLKKYVVIYIICVKMQSLRYQFPFQISNKQKNKTQEQNRADAVSDASCKDIATTAVVEPSNILRLLH